MNGFARIALAATATSILIGGAVPAHAAPAPGLNVVAYEMVGYPHDPQPTWQELEWYDECPVGYDTWYANIDQDWYGGVVANCRDDNVLVHYSGFITVPVSGLYTFESYADDGFVLYIDDTSVSEDWTAHAPTYFGGEIALTAGKSYSIDVWYLEIEEAAVSHLTYSFGSADREIVPADWFTLEPYPESLPEPLAETGVDPTQLLSWAVAVGALGLGARIFSRRRSV